MKVFKFGGASVKNAQAVRNVADILKKHEGTQLVVVISAMGKTTNALEEVLNMYWKKDDFSLKLNQIKDYHYNIMDSLFVNRKAQVYNLIGNTFGQIENILTENTSANYDYLYDQVVGFGEILSTQIVSAYLSIFGYRHIWADARKFIFTDDLYREARVNFEQTNQAIQDQLLPEIENHAVITQGFIGSCDKSFSTTLGREGSDYTASIIAAALNAEELIIWKDVPGILNADPHRFPNTTKFDTLSYRDAVEMTYYGASVLHPKTIKPVENKHIPLHVKSFLYPEKKGTVIKADVADKEKIPVIILKQKQLLFTFSTLNLSFIAEENVRRIFEEVVRYGIKVNTMQNSAISFAISIDDMGQKVQDFYEALLQDFTITKTENLQLLTLKNADEEMIRQLLEDKNIVLELRTPHNAQFVIETAF